MTGVPGGLMLSSVLLLLGVNCLRFKLLPGNDLTATERNFIIPLSFSEVKDINDTAGLGAFLRFHGVPQPPIPVVPSDFLRNHLEQVNICAGKGNLEALLLSACFRTLPATLCYEKTGEHWDPLFLHHLVSLHPSPHFEHRLWFVRRDTTNAFVPSMLYLNSSDPISLSWSEIIAPYITKFANHKSVLLSLVALYNAIPMQYDYGSEQLSIMRRLWRTEWTNDEEFERGTKAEFLWEVMLENGYFDEYRFGDSWLERVDRMRTWIGTPWNRGMFESSLCILPTEAGWKRLHTMLIPTLNAGPIKIPCHAQQMINSLLLVIFKYDQVGYIVWMRMQFEVLNLLFKRYPSEMNTPALLPTLTRLWNKPDPLTIPVKILCNLIETLRTVVSPELFTAIMEELVINDFEKRFRSFHILPSDFPNVIQCFLKYPLQYLQSKPEAVAHLLRPWLRLGAQIFPSLRSVPIDFYEAGLLSLLREKVRRESEFLDEVRTGSFDFQIFSLITEEQYQLLFEHSSDEFIAALHELVSPTDQLVNQMDNLTL